MNRLTSLPHGCLSLFNIKPKTGFNITYKTANREDSSQVQDICSLAGLNDEIISIEQPCNSAEINSQNFKVIFKSGDKLLIRRCHKLKGLEKYNFLHDIFRLLKKDGVRTPELYSSEFSKLIYLETSKTIQKVCWVFFKYIEAVQQFSGESKMLEEAAEQVGKMHACLKKYPMKTEEHVISRPTLLLSEWESYKKIMLEKATLDTYDECFLQNCQLLENAIKFVEENDSFLKDQNDKQLIHFDLNSSNFILDEKMQINIMDFDELKIGNIYTDIAFALHRLVTTCVEQGNKDLRNLVAGFLENYQKGNSAIKIDYKKLKVAMYDRALRNIKTNLSLKYVENSQDWLSSIPLNIRRLQQVIGLCDLFA